MTRNEIIQQITQTIQGSPYILKETKKGFDLELNVADMDWLTVFYKNKLSVMYKIGVQIDEEKHEYAMSQTVNRMEWNGGVGANGVPSFSSSMSSFTGSLIVKRAEIQGGFHKGGGLFNGYYLNTTEMATPVIETMEKAGYQRRMDNATKVGLWFGIGGIAIALASVILALVMSNNQ